MAGFAHTEVRDDNGVPAIFVDGRPLHGMTATSCAFNDPQVVRDFAESGVEIMMIWIEIGIKCWKGPGQYDWSYAEEKLRHFEEHSGDTRWIMRNRVSLLDPWFARAYPTEVHNPPDAAGNFQGTMSAANIVSSVWCEQVKELITAFVTWLKGTKWAERIIGFMLNAGGTEEWLVFNTDELYRGQYPEVVQREFRSWLRREYRDDEAALQAAWQGKEVGDVLAPLDDQGRPPTFEDATGPTGHIRKGSHIWGPYSLRDPLYERQAIDYYRFLNDIVSDHLVAFCKSAKEAAQTPVICGGFHSYLWWESGVYGYIQEYGHALIQKLMASPWVDFTSDITSYDVRYPGGPSGYLGLPHTHNVSGKLHYTEVDLVTINQLEPEHQAAWAAADTSNIPARSSEPVIPQKVWGWNKNYCGRDMDEQIAILQREHFHNLITGTAYWWFDIRQHDYQPAPIKSCLKQMSDIGKQAVEWNRASASEVAYIVSEDTPMFQAAMNGELLRFELESNHGLLLDGCNKQWGLAGMPYDIYELHDLAKPGFKGEQYKLFVFVNCGRISEAAAAGIRKWQKDGRVFCWTYAAGVTDYDGLDPAKNADLIGIKLGWRNQRQQIRVLVDDAKHALARGGSALDFGTEGSVGPVFYVDDPEATVLGRLRDGGEAAFAVREHSAWRSVYLSMLNFGPAMLRNLTNYAGAHVWCDTDDVVYANKSLLCLHTASKGAKTIALPKPAVVTDLWTGKRTDAAIERIETDAQAYRTHIWRTEYEGGA